MPAGGGHLCQRVNGHIMLYVQSAWSRSRRLEIWRENRMCMRVVVPLVVWSLLNNHVVAEAPKVVVPLAKAHAHNDYHHKRPLLDALDHGFCSVEADVFLVGDELQVAHSRSELKPERTLQSLYLEPLRQRVEQNNGRVYPNGPSFTLMIDIKSEGSATYEALHKLLSQYEAILTRVQSGRRIAGAIDIVVSGNRATAVIAANDPRYVGIDGRLSDLNSDQPADLLPMISDNWSNHFRWRGTGEIPAVEKKKLREVVTQAHNAGRRVRFWATPETPAMWMELYDAGVDAINTDRLDELQAFLLERRQK